MIAKIKSIKAITSAISAATPIFFGGNTRRPGHAVALVRSLRKETDDGVPKDKNHSPLDTGVSRSVCPESSIPVSMHTHLMAVYNFPLYVHLEPGDGVIALALVPSTAVSQPFMCMGAFVCSLNLDPSRNQKSVVHHHPHVISRLLSFFSVLSHAHSHVRRFQHKKSQ